MFRWKSTIFSVFKFQIFIPLGMVDEPGPWLYYYRRRNNS